MSNWTDFVSRVQKINGSQVNKPKKLFCSEKPLGFTVKRTKFKILIEETTKTRKYIKSDSVGIQNIILRLKTLFSQHKLKSNSSKFKLDVKNAIFMQNQIIVS